MLSKHNDLSAEQEAIVSKAIGCGIAVHRELGPGFKECIYHAAFRLELDSRGIAFESDKTNSREISQTGRFPGRQIDLIVDGVVLVELKAVPRLRAAASISGAVLPS